jgi:hypothetical protein
MEALIPNAAATTRDLKLEACPFEKQEVRYVSFGVYTHVCRRLRYHGCGTNPSHGGERKLETG